MTIIHFLLICSIFWLIFGILGLLQRRSDKNRLKLQYKRYTPVDSQKLVHALKEAGYKLNIYKGKAG